MAKLVVLISRDREKGVDIAEAWQKRCGATGVTIIDSYGLGSLEEQRQSKELPMFISMASVLHQVRATNQMLFSAVEDHLVDSMIEVAQEMMGSLDNPDTGILFVVPIDRVVGLAHKGRK
ncbi:MAG: hypothetical protein H6672_05920 [Anaerolineaceae bacterium]|nr:hypothetical protein [Anaerolineaceae bacterium]